MKTHEQHSLIIGERFNSKEAPLDLAHFMYKGAANIRRTFVPAQIKDGTLGRPRPLRYPVLRRIFDVLQDAWATGRSIATLESNYWALTKIYRLADSLNLDPTYQNLEELFDKWIEDTNRRVRKRELSAVSAHSLAASVGRIFAEILGEPSREFLSKKGIEKARLQKPSQKNFTINLEVASGFVRDLRHIAALLDKEKIFHTLPIEIAIGRDGEVFKHHCGISHDERFRPESDLQFKENWWLKKRYKRRDTARNDLSVKRRLPLFNLRVAADYMLFVAATGMNPSQVTKLTMGDYRFQSFEDGYRIRKYKERAGGDVEFSVASSYRPIFENYLQFRREVHPAKSSLLFPTMVKDGISSKKFNLKNLRSVFLATNRPWITAKDLRTLKANFIFRVADNSAIESLILQHGENTFRYHYEEPNHQRATRELSQYFKTIAPARVSTLSVAAGSCGSAHNPALLNASLENATVPDCITPAGCLFCVHHKGISSFDYIWGIASFLELKRAELSSYKREPRGGLPKLRATANRLEEIIEAFASQSLRQEEWTSRALNNVTKRIYHPRWAGFIRLVEEIA